MLETYSGQCHCGAIRFEVDADLDGRKAICRCTRCTMLGFLHHHVPAARFRLLTDPAAIQEYRFGTMTAVHRFCRTCGVQPFYQSRSDPDLVDVNLRCLQGIEVHELDYELSDGRNWEAYQEVRRERERRAGEGAPVPRPEKWRILWRNPYATFSAEAAFRSAWE